jgi:hypothetical protein
MCEVSLNSNHHCILRASRLSPEGGWYATFTQTICGRIEHVKLYVLPPYRGAGNNDIL